MNCFHFILIDKYVIISLYFKFYLFNLFRLYFSSEFFIFKVSAKLLELIFNIIVIKLGLLLACFLKKEKERYGNRVTFSLRNRGNDQILPLPSSKGILLFRFVRMNLHILMCRSGTGFAR
ncbi:hypothetical protein O3M35_003766 [Rhynocoris fuscipes]|uniref:Uncharacterized protein n=1 Tax=Rhynocoris fuscipes TaxID=488301 RepID=A0AAW1CHD6_9HEMI